MLGFKVFFIFVCLIIAVSAQVAGGATELQGDERTRAKQILRKDLPKLDPRGTYRLLSVESVTGQVVAGMKYNYEAAVAVNNVRKQCKASIVRQEWSNKDDSVVLRCPGMQAVRQDVPKN